MSSQTTERETLTFLLICDEWSPAKGGISRFNQCLACALVAAGHRVLCLVKTVTSPELKHARAHRVELIAAMHAPAGPNLNLAVPRVQAARPDVVIGHDLVSGSPAWVHARHYLPDATLVCILHTAYSQNEPYKHPDDAGDRVDEYERLIRKVCADVFAAVGPRLTRKAKAVLGAGHKVVLLEPGIEVPADQADLVREPPDDRTVIVLGRPDHIVAKGLDIAAKAIGRLEVPRGDPLPELLIRGTRPGQEAPLRAELVKQSGLALNRIDVRKFILDDDEIARDLHRSVLCLMPSRVEGFGLSGLEAIQWGTPVLVSSVSGLAETLRNHLGPTADSMIVDVRDDDQDVQRWTVAIKHALDNLSERFAYTHEIRRRLGKELTWEITAKTLIVAIREARSAGQP